MKNKTLALAASYNPYLARAIALCAGVIALSLFLYGFFLLEAVAHTAQRAQAETKIEDLNSKLSSLEETYLSKSSGLTLQYAEGLGYVPVAATPVSADAPAHGLSMRVQY